MVPPPSKGIGSHRTNQGACPSRQDQHPTRDDEEKHGDPASEGDGGAEKDEEGTRKRAGGVAQTKVTNVASGGDQEARHGHGGANVGNEAQSTDDKRSPTRNG